MSTDLEIVDGRPVLRLQRLRPQRIEPAAPLCSGGDEPGIAQDAEVLRDARLAQPELIDELAHRLLAVAQEVEDRPAVGLGQRRVGRHALHITEW